MFGGRSLIVSLLVWVRRGLLVVVVAGVICVLG